MEFWNEDVFIGVARSFGDLLSIDLITKPRRRLTYAHICIGVVEGVDMPEVVSFHSKLEIHVQKLVYESVPFACFHCLKKGHQAKQCLKAKEEKNRKKATYKPQTQKEGNKVWKQKNNMALEISHTEYREVAVDIPIKEVNVSVLINP